MSPKSDPQICDLFKINPSHLPGGIQIEEGMLCCHYSSDPICPPRCLLMLDFRRKYKKLRSVKLSTGRLLIAVLQLGKHTIQVPLFFLLPLLSFFLFFHFHFFFFYISLISHFSFLISHFSFLISHFSFYFLSKIN